MVGLAAGENADLLGRADRALPAARSRRWPPATRSIGCAERRRGRRARSRGTGRDGLVAVASHPDVDIVLCASSRHRRARSGARRDRARQDDRAGEQGSAGDGRRHRHRRGAARTASRFCRSTASTTRFTSACTAATRAEVRRLILTASGGPFRGRSAAELAGVSAAEALQASDLADGPQDHDRLGDADEQGARGDRGALAVRRPRRSDRRRRPPAVGRALDGRAGRRIGHRAARRHRHAAADSVRVLVSGAMGGAAAAARSGARRPARLRRRPTPTRFRACASRIARSRPSAACRSC